MGDVQATFTVNSASVDLGSPSFNDFVKSPVLLNADRFPTLSFHFDGGREVGRAHRARDRNPHDARRDQADHADRQC